MRLTRANVGRGVALFVGRYVLSLSTRGLYLGWQEPLTRGGASHDLFIWPSPPKITQ